MGCISSKIATRTRSFREELGQSFQRRINGLPMLDDLLISKDEGDQFLAFVCTANTVAKKLQTGTLPSQSNTDRDQPFEHMNRETINTSELMNGLEEQQQQQSQTPHREVGHNDQAVAAEDFHKSKENTLASGGNCTMLSNNFNVVTTNASVGDIGVLVRSTSVHTVEEYDALVRTSHLQSEGVNVNVGAHFEQFNNFNIGKANGSIRDNNGLHLRSRSYQSLEGYDINRWSEVSGSTRVGDTRIDAGGQNPEVSRSSSCKSTLLSQRIGIVKKDDESTIMDQDKPIEVQEISANSSNFKNLEFNNMDISECPSNLSSTDAVGINGDTSNKVNFTIEKGLRRKAKAKELTPLNVPTTTVDFPRIGSLGGWLEVGDQVFASGDYVTPRFGNFNVPISITGNNGHAIFDPEMVAAFEEAMEELTVEEECILKQIEADTDEEGKTVKEVEEKIPNHIQV